MTAQRQRGGKVLRKLRHGFEARVRVFGKRRGWSLPLSLTEAEARARLDVLAEMARRLSEVTDEVETRRLLGQAAKARAGRVFDTVVAAVNLICSGKAPSKDEAAQVTFADFAGQWTRSELHRLYPDHVGKKDSTRDEEVLRLYVIPVLGLELLRDIELVHIEQVMAALPAHLSPRTRKLIAQCVRRLLSLAVYPGRHISVNPIPREWMPKIPKGSNKAKTLLYPDEDAKLLGCTEIPFERRLAYGILIREGMRLSELAQLNWRDVDLEHGRVRLDKNKTDDPRAWALSPDVARTLAWWKKESDADDDGLVIRIDLTHGVRWLRGHHLWKPGDTKSRQGDLRTAGVTRPELFERTKVRQPLRLHDLRASFVTISLANSKTEQWVTDRTGHKSSAMLALYTRQARTWAEIGMGTLGYLDALLPEVPDPTHTVRPKGGARKVKKQGAAHDAAHVVTGGVAEWSKAAVLKTAVDASPPGVRISPPPLRSLGKRTGCPMRAQCTGPKPGPKPRGSWM